MFLEESLWIREALATLDLGSGRVVLNVGSSSEEFRCLHQPFIDYHVFRPLRRKGVKIVHLDGRAAEGVDVICDVAAPTADDILNGLQADVVIVSNLLEHVTNREIVVQWLKGLVKPSGTLIVTAPHVYRRHDDPIDTMYRPTNSDLEVLFPEFEARRSEILQVEAEMVIRPLSRWKRMVNHVAFSLYRKMPFQPVIIKNQVSVVAFTARS